MDIMNIYRISQTAVTGYDTFSCAVVYARSEEDARRVDPSGFYTWDSEQDCWLFCYHGGGVSAEGEKRYDWPDHVRDVEVELLAKHVPTQVPGDSTGAMGHRVICSSFHAG